ncbi:MAG: hypothetical protein O2960_25375, partial [Verrucomicrobia bacterium]|nr:hypothetical protein [Verrucomicrobiota bacterium]
KVVGILLGGSAEGGLPSFGDAPVALQPAQFGWRHCLYSLNCGTYEHPSFILGIEIVRLVFS